MGTVFFYLCGKIFSEKLKNAVYGVFMICKEKTKTTKRRDHYGKYNSYKELQSKGRPTETAR